MKYKLIIFDLDGTILDTLDDLYESVNFSLSEHSLPLRTREEVRAFVGNGIRKLIERSVPENTDVQLTENVFDSFRSHYGDNSSNKTQPYDGVVALIDKLRENNVHTAVVSNKADFAVKALVDKYFPDKFDYAVGEREGIARKPAPDSVLEVIKHLGCNNKDCVYIGDSEVDVITARNSDIDCIAVLWGFRDKEVLLSNGAEKIAENTEMLLNLLS